MTPPPVPVDPASSTDSLNLLVALFALAVGLASGYFTWRAYAMQRTSSTPFGLQFLIAPVNRLRPINDFAVHVALGVYARGPGVRYNTTLVWWGDADVREFSDSRTTWSAEDGPLSCEVALQGHELEQPVYFGVVWESPSFWRRIFIEHGYRVQLKWAVEAESIKVDHFEVWKDSARVGTKGEWRLMPSSTEGGDHTSESAAGYFRSSATLNDQLKRTAEARKWDGIPFHNTSRE